MSSICSALRAGILSPALVIVSAGCALADSAKTNLSLQSQFDQIIIPIVEKAVRQPVTDQGGEIAWGESSNSQRWWKCSASRATQSTRR